ncbi:uncharacterized protein SOCE26_000780 [Sorangium cellulosum]|uniref:Uncharacterized protein n=1 Tax=Sorangium cellulosum TaxID=56 RepID=A0A2L0EHD2_SORCE|nr:Vps62-related protein [Sorangium cellulosum]AUX38700.1 uncharacterized protein SOCE26_000780 [Sorangium cellulosum]
MSDPQVTLFSDSKYRGSQSTLSIGRYATGFGISNDALSSIKIPDGLKVTLCEHGNFEGRRCTLIRDTPHLKGVNDTTSSIIVERLTTPTVAAPDWMQYCRRWGPRITYKSSDVKGSIKSSLGGIPYADKAVDWIYGAIPEEAKEENGPTGPWMKGAWTNDE